MRDGFKSIEIEPTEGYLDFIGPAKSENTNEPARVLKGQVKFTLTKATKIRNMSVKFKGFSQITLQQASQVEVSTPLLPKLKLPLFGKTTLPAGDHIIPWELDIPNIYPRSILIKRASINYKVMVSISTGLTRTLTAEYPIVLRRHLLPYKELAPIIETKLFQRTVPGKFHYEIDAPQIVCIEQEHIPMAIKYISFANHKPVKNIRTRLVQIELYRRQSLSKSEMNLSYTNRDSHIFDLDHKMADANHYKDTHLKYIKRTVPALLHIPDSSTSTWKRPCLVKHRLHPYLSYTLDSPLVSIYHQIEVTFQFGMKYEEIKARIPIIIASIPKRESSAISEPSDDMMMKYAFEEVARSDFLPYRLESRSSTNRVTDEDVMISNDDNYSVLRDTSIMPGTSDDEEGQITGRVTPMMFVNNMNNIKLHAPKMPYTVTNNASSSSQYDIQSPPSIQNQQRALSPTFYNSIPEEQHRQLKKFASAFDLSTVSQESCPMDDVVIPEERPRTTTPTMRRQPMYRKVLPPINVDLANRKDRGTPAPPPDIPPPPIPTSTTVKSASDSSDVLPAVDRAAIQSRNTNHSTTQNSNNRKNRMWGGPLTSDDASDDLRSVYSDTSMTSANAPSLSSSATLSTNKSHPTLHSRPPSPVFSPAPGLPATIALRPQEIQASQVEEMFPDSATAMSPAMNTVASSALLSPRTSYALRRRIALSTISSLTNDSLQLGPSMLSRARSSSTVDPEVQSLLMSRYSDSNSYESSPPPPFRYMNARLPPIPTNPNTTNTTNTAATTNANNNASKRLTKIYIDDSDDEGGEEEITPDIPSLPPLASANTNSLIQDDCAPPRLPRLSFGGDFGISLGI